MNYNTKLIGITDELLDDCPSLAKSIRDHVTLDYVIRGMQAKFSAEELELLSNYLLRTTKKKFIKRLKGE